MLREDTVVSNLPSFDRDDEKTNLAGPRGARFRESRTDAHIASIGAGAPPQPRGWGAAAAPRPKNLRLVGEPPSTIHDRPAPEPGPPPVPPRATAQAKPAGKQIVPIPEPDYEPSVVATVPRPPVQQPAREQVPAVEPSPETQGTVLVLFSCRGGAGSTTLAVNTAASLARAGKSVCVVDLDLQLGDVFVAMDLEPTTSIAALAREASTIDAAALRRRLARHDSGVYAITQTGHPGDVDPQLPERMPALLATLSAQFDYVVIDGVRDFGDIALAALDMADRVQMVMSQDVASVRRAARAVQLFRRLGYSETKLELLLNRASRKARVGEPEIVRALGMPVSARVRNDFKKATGAMDDGAMVGQVARGSGLDKDITKLAARLCGAGGRSDTAPAAKSGGLLSLFKRSTKKGGSR